MNSARTPRVSRSRGIALVLGLLVIACGAPGIFAQGKKPAAPADAAERDALIVRVLAAYQERFRYLRDEEAQLALKAIDDKVRAKLPGILKADAATVKAILAEDASRLAAAPGTPIEQKLGALFVTARYETVIEEGEKHAAPLSAASLRTMGDAARVIYRKTPGKKHVETAARHYTAAAALVDKAKAPGEWADIASDAALALFDLARYKEAEPLWREVAEIRKRENGEKSPTYSTALNNLAQLLKATNRMAEAEPMYRSALAIDEASFGDKHLRVSRDLSNLAGLLKATKRMAEAEPLYRRALAIDEASFGDKHPNVARNLNNLAGLLEATNRMAEAEPMYRRALAIAEASFGDKHPNAAISLNNLAHLLKVTKRPEEAEPMYRRALEILDKSLGSEHPNTITARKNLDAMREEMKK
jgi:tetratricopeptide (TPR) repeat protein